MRWLPLVLLACAWLTAADLPDPTASWKPRDLLPCLIALRRPLDLAPDDQRLLARAQQAYVEFAFGGPAELNGAAGPWLGYATELSARRRALRKGAPHADLADALPDLWLAFIQGDASAAVEGLDRWPEAADLPEVRALRLAATRDLGLVAGHPPTTALEWYGYLTACAAQQVAAPLTGDEEIPGVDTLTWRLLANRDPRISVSQVLADIPWLLVPASIPEEVACRHLAALVTAYGRVPPPGATRQELISEAVAGLDDFDFEHVEPFIAGIAACRELRRSVPRGIRQEDGLHLLVGVPDVAWWLQDRLFLACIEQLAWTDPAGDRPVRTGAVFAQAMPGSLFATRTLVGTWCNEPERGMSLLTAIRAEVDDPLGVSPGVAIRAVEMGVRVAGPQSAPALMDLARHLHPDGIPRHGIGIANLVRAFPLWSCRDALAPLALAASRRDPYDQRLWEAGRFADPGYALVELADLEPALRRVDAQVDIVERKVLPAGSGVGIAATWEGALRIDADGDYRFALDAGDAARLDLGDLQLLLTGTAGMADGRVRLTAGWVPLRLAWWNGDDHGRVRLLWADASGAWVPVPAARLGHGPDHRPGLAATYWRDAHWVRVGGGARPADALRAHDMPWLIATRFYLGRGLHDIGRYEQSLAHLEVVRQAGWEDFELPWRYLDSLAWAGGPERGKDLLAYLMDHLWAVSDIGPAARIAGTLGRAGLQQEFLARLPPNVRLRGAGEWIPSRMALALGDFPGALRHLDGMQTDARTHLHWRVELESAILGRLADGTEPDFALLRDLSLDERPTPSLRLALSWYTGGITWAEALARAQTVPDGDEILWYRGLHELTLGNHAVARELFARLPAAHPDWQETTDAAALLAWYARQTPESLAKLIPAKPLPEGPERPRGGGF